MAAGGTERESQQGEKYGDRNFTHCKTMPEVKPDTNAQGRFRQGNRVNVTHGVYGYLATGSLPRGASYIRRQLAGYRKGLEAAVLELRGEITIYSASLIQSAIRHEGRATLLQRWLRQQEKDLSYSDKVSTLREIGSATDARDRCLKALGLDDADRPESILDSLYAPTLPPEPEGSDDANQ